MNHRRIAAAAGTAWFVSTISTVLGVAEAFEYVVGRQSVARSSARWMNRR